MTKSLDVKLERIRKDSSVSDFIIADAKDADMGPGISAPGVNTGDDNAQLPFRSLACYRRSIREITEQGLVDIMLMSPSTCEQLSLREELFDESTVTPSARANDTTDIWLGQSGYYHNQPSLPFRTATIDHIQCGRVSCTEPERTNGVDLGLYSVTFNNDAVLDSQVLRQYRDFRVEAEQKGFRHFLEVFAPNRPANPIADISRYVNDCIARCLAGVTSRARPLFLKMPYFGPAAMERLVHYDPGLVAGVLGGSAGTTHDAFRLLWEARKYGARAALFGRKINNSEHQLTFVRFLRELADGNVSPEEAVKAYHGELTTMDIRPFRPLADDLELTQFHDRT